MRRHTLASSMLISALAAGAASAGPLDIHFNGGSINNSLMGGGGWGRGFCGGGGGLNIDGSYHGGNWDIHFSLNNNIGFGDGTWGGGWGGWGSGISYGGGGLSTSITNGGLYLVPPTGAIYTQGAGWTWDGYHWQPPANWLPYSSYGSYWGNSFGYYQNRRGMGVIAGPGSRIDPALLPGVGPDTFMRPNDKAAEPPPPPPLTTMEKARLALRGAKLDEAKTLLKEQLKAEPEDAQAAMLLSMALIEHKEIEDGIALLRATYRKDPTLADKAISDADAGFTENRFRDLVTKVVPHAHKTNSPSSWFAAAVFMQADGRYAQAEKMLDKAKTAGLEREVSDRLAVALKDAIKAQKDKKAGKKPDAAATLPAATPAPAPAPAAAPATPAQPMPK